MTALLSALVVLTGAADPGAEVAWGVKTAPDETGQGRQYFAFIVAPGTTIDDALIISNHDDAPLTLDVYAADGFTTESGQLDVLPRAEESSEVGSWIVVDTNQITIPAGESLQVPFTVAVPDNATPGDYAGGVVTSLPLSGEGSGVTVDRRLGIRVQLRVDGALAPGIVVDDMHVDYLPSANPFGQASAVVDYTIRNTGNTRWSADQSITLSGPFGLFPTMLRGLEPIPELLPGDSWSVSARSDAVIPTFWLNAELSLYPAEPEGFGSEYVPPSLAVHAGAFAMPWTILVLLALVTAAIFWQVWAHRRRKAREEARVSAAVESALSLAAGGPGPTNEHSARDDAASRTRPS